MKPLDLRDDAPWRERFRTAIIAYAFTAAANPARGLACTNQTGVFQLYAWDVPTGQLTQLTHHERGKIVGSLSADGHYVYYLNDDKGNEVGHYVRVPFEGGPAEDITPDLPPYSSFGVNHSKGGNRIGFMTAGRDGFQAMIMDAAADGTLGEPRPLWSSRALSFGPGLSQGGEIGVVATTERTGRNEYSLIALDATTGEKIAELWDENASI